MIEIRYIQISKEIESGIASGRWQGRLPGVVRLGKELGADPATVSKALKILARKGLVTVEGTRGTFIAERGAGGAKYNRIALVGFTHIDKDQIETERMRETMRDRGYEMVIIEYGKLDRAVSLLVTHGMKADGLIFCNSTLNPDIVSELRKEGIPFVSMNRISDVQGVNWVDFDNEQGLEDALRYLIRIGHRRIAYIAYRYALNEHENRISALYERVMQSEQTFDRKLYVADEEYARGRYGENEHALYAARRIRRLMGFKNPPTAAYVNSIQMAHGVHEELESQGIDVPRDFSIISGIESDVQRRAETFLTLSTCMFRERAIIASQTLMNLIDNPDSPVVQKLLPRKLVLQKTTTPLKP